MTAKLKRVTLDDLSIGEILSFMDETFCGDKSLYFKYGRDLRSCWYYLVTKKFDHYTTFCDAIGFEESKQRLNEATDMVMKVMKANVSRDNVLAKLSVIPDDWFKPEDGDPAAEDQYQDFRDQLTGHLAARFKNNPAWGLTMVPYKKPKTPKPAKKPTKKK